MNVRFRMAASPRKRVVFAGVVAILLLFRFSLAQEHIADEPERAAQVQQGEEQSNAPTVVEDAAETAATADTDSADPRMLEGPAISEAAEATVTFQNIGKSFPVRDGQTICELAEEHGIEITAECHSGICGSDPIRIVSGEDNLQPMGGNEEATLEEICDLSPEGHRVACMARPTGPVVVEIIES